MKYIVGVDEGTTGCNVVLFNENGKQIVVASEEYASYYPHPGWVEQDIIEIKDAVFRCIHEVIKTSAVDVNDIVGVVDDRSAELDSFMLGLASLSDKLVAVAASADTTLVGVNEFVSVLNGSDISGLVSSFKALLESMNDPDGTIGKLLTDDSVYDSVDALLNNVDTLVRKIEENPKKYIKISVF